MLTGRGCLPLDFDPVTPSCYDSNHVRYFDETFYDASDRMVVSSDNKSETSGLSPRELGVRNKHRIEHHRTLTKLPTLSHVIDSDAVNRDVSSNTSTRSSSVTATFEYAGLNVVVQSTKLVYATLIGDSHNAN